jgi:hypothetical protein
MRLQNILFIALGLVAFSSCSVYRAGQTPDDVYYSPGRSDDSYVMVDNGRRGYDNADSYYTPEDNYLRMRVRDRNRWSAIDQYNYMNDWQYTPGYGGFYSPYSYYNPYSWYSPYGINAYWNSFYMWNSYYNPYYNYMIIGGGKTNPIVYNNAVRTYSRGSYINSGGYNTRNAYSNGGRTTIGSPGGRYNTSNGGSYYNNNSGGLRRGYTDRNSGSYVPSNNSAPVRSYQPATPSYSPSYSPGARGGGSSGGGGGVPSRPSGRGGR